MTCFHKRVWSKGHYHWLLVYRAKVDYSSADYDKHKNKNIEEEASEMWINIGTKLKDHCRIVLVKPLITHVEV